MGKEMDLTGLTTTLMGVIEENLAKMSNVVATDAPVTKVLDIVEYEGRMRVSGMEKFNSPCFLSYVNFYLSIVDQEKHKAKGALVLYVGSENAGKLYKFLGIPVPEDEDDSSMMEANGKFCQILADGLKAELVKSGCPELVLSEAENYRNSVMEGIEFSSDQKSKIECSFFYWKLKTLVVELTLTDIPQK